jgi:hypothetical protein
LEKWDANQEGLFVAGRIEEVIVGWIWMSWYARCTVKVESIYYAIWRD